MLDAEEFAALRELAATNLGVDARLIEKDYWATRVLRAATRPVDGADTVFKGGTSLSKAFQISDRFSEDVDLLIVTEERGKPLKRRLRAVADAVSAELGVEHGREAEGKGYLNAASNTPPVSITCRFSPAGFSSRWGREEGPRPTNSAGCDR
jgi:predicted nucleotidyltransferase component of viral defense system